MNLNKVAKLVGVSLVTRVVVYQDATDEQIYSVAVPRLIAGLRQAGLDNLEFIKEDLECPYEITQEDILKESSPSTISNNASCRSNRRLIGYQIESADGNHIIPDGLYSFMVLSETAADLWLDIDKRNPTGDWVKVPVYSGDIDDPVLSFSIPQSHDRK